MLEIASFEGLNSFGIMEVCSIIGELNILEDMGAIIAPCYGEFNSIYSL